MIPPTEIESAVGAPFPVDPAAWEPADPTWPCMKWLPEVLANPFISICIEENLFFRWFRVRRRRPTLEERIAALEARL